MTFLSGFIAILGPPNVGKSTLLNRIVGAKLSIVSPKPQTTRNRVLGIHHGDGFQMIFMDTPGIHKTRTPLHRSMVDSAYSAFQEVDILVLMIDMKDPEAPEIPSLIGVAKRSEKPALLVINKIDRGNKSEILPVIGKFSDEAFFDAIIPVSALKGDGVPELLEAIRTKLKPGPPFFPPDMRTDQPDTFMMSEIIREKIYLFTRHELPYSSAVTVERVEEAAEKNLLRIFAVVHVETLSQKGILVGRQGTMVKKIGEAARMELERCFNVQVYLNLTVRVSKNWSRDTRALRRLGY
ncbi:MAG: GTPase Era [Deltaproteobacteria bacterium]|nr:MAG: GTPase Era [Deltaproteobacteria bacterium]